jgi:hypothetical protein
MASTPSFLDKDVQKAKGGPTKGATAFSLSLSGAEALMVDRSDERTTLGTANVDIRLMGARPQEQSSGSLLGPEISRSMPSPSAQYSQQS